MPSNKKQYKIVFIGVNATTNERVYGLWHESGRYIGKMSSLKVVAERMVKLNATNS